MQLALFPPPSPDHTDLPSSHVALCAVVDVTSLPPPFQSPLDTLCSACVCIKIQVALSGPLLGQTYPLYVWMSLLPIVAGCSMSAMKEVSFAWSGFNNAMISNLGMVLRNIYSKKSMVNYKVRA